MEKATGTGYRSGLQRMQKHFRTGPLRKLPPLPPVRRVGSQEPPPVKAVDLKNRPIQTSGSCCHHYFHNFLSIPTKPVTRDQNTFSEKLNIHMTMLASTKSQRNKKLCSTSLSPSKSQVPLIGKPTLQPISRMPSARKCGKHGVQLSSLCPTGKSTEMILEGMLNSSPYVYHNTSHQRLVGLSSTVNPKRLSANLVESI